MLVAIGMKLVVNLMLVPNYGIEGAAIGTSVAFLGMAAFNFNRLDRVIPLGMLRFKHYGLLVKTVTPMGLVLFGLNVLALDRMTHRLDAFVWLGGMVLIGAGLYAWRLWRERVLSIGEWEMIPLGNRFVNLMDKKEN